MKRIGITGPTGAGKTTALGALEDLGACVIDADAVYHQLLADSAPLRSALADRFGPAILDGAGNTILAATSRWLLLDLHTGRATTVTPALAQRYALWDHKAIPGEIPANGRSPEGAAETFAYTALGRDLDTFHHVNNLHYLELAREALPPETAAADLPNVEILYKRQIRKGDTVHFLCSCTDGKHLVELKDSSLKKTHALLWFYA